MTDLPDFLLARFDEDEAVARAATGEEWRPGAFVQDGRRLWQVCAVPRPLVARVEAEADAAHIARHDPARVLAECEAKRRIVDEAIDYSPELSAGDNGEWAFEVTLRLLALPYAGHPDYREEWKL